MTQSLFDQTGSRKYLVALERLAFVRAACAENNRIAAFCIVLAVTGARLSEVLALTPERIDMANEAIVFRTLKQRDKIIFRAVPIPRHLIEMVCRVQPLDSDSGRLWSWGRTTAWTHVKRVMKSAGIANALCKPKALRHGFAINAGQNGVSLNVIQRWLGHARLETTAIYAEALGHEERVLAQRTWRGINQVLADRLLPSLGGRRI